MPHENTGRFEITFGNERPRVNSEIRAVVTQVSAVFNSRPIITSKKGLALKGLPISSRDLSCLTEFYPGGVSERALDLVMRKACSLKYLKQVESGYVPTSEGESLVIPMNDSYFDENYRQSQRISRFYNEVGRIHGRFI